MKIYLKDLQDQKIQKLIINSLEQALYQAVVLINGEEYIVWETKETTLLRRNLMELRKLFAVFDISEVVLRQESPYDEMIGMPKNHESNRLEVPLGKNPYALPKWLNSRSLN